MDCGEQGSSLSEPQWTRISIGKGEWVIEEDISYLKPFEENITPATDKMFVKRITCNHISITRICFQSHLATFKCPKDYLWPFDDGTKCCKSYGNTNRPDKKLDYYDPISSCLNGAYIECPGHKIGISCTIYGGKLFYNLKILIRPDLFTVNKT